MKLIHITAAILCMVSLSAGTIKEKFKERVQEVKSAIPGIGLVSEVEYDGLTIRNFRFDTDEKYTIVDPGEKISATLDYEIDADRLGNLHLHHFFYGLHPFGPIGCLVHSVGLKDSTGTAEITFNAPEESGFYELRVCHSPSRIICSKAREEWYRGDNPPKNTILGVVYVE